MSGSLDWHWGSTSKTVHPRGCACCCQEAWVPLHGGSSVGLLECPCDIICHINNPERVRRKAVMSSMTWPQTSQHHLHCPVAGHLSPVRPMHGRRCPREELPPDIGGGWGSAWKLAITPGPKPLFLLPLCTSGSQTWMSSSEKLLKVKILRCHPRCFALFRPRNLYFQFSEAIPVITLGTYGPFGVST